MRLCPRCNATFSIPKNDRHKICPPCRGKERKSQVSRLCAVCDKVVTVKAVYCNDHVVRPWTSNGRTYHKKGYVLLRVPEHPRSSKNNPYVFEHILVMEEFIGRFLIKGENVHHKNGIRDDNRIENLELWNKPQPSGARAEDLYAWALELVELYEPLFKEKELQKIKTAGML